jgi:hypothetical protein
MRTEVTRRNGSALIEALEQSGFSNEDAESFVKKNKSKGLFEDRPFKLSRMAWLLLHDLGEFNLVNDPEVTISYDQSWCEGWGCNPKKHAHTSLNGKLKLSSIELVNPFIGHEKKLSYAEACERVRREHTLATLFEWKWFLEHEEFIPKPWMELSKWTHIVFAGIPCMGRDSEQEMYPALARESHSERWTRGDVVGRNDAYAENQPRFAIIVEPKKS